MNYPYKMNHPYEVKKLMGSARQRRADFLSLKLRNKNHSSNFLEMIKKNEPLSNYDINNYIKLHPYKIRKHYKGIKIVSQLNKAPYLVSTGDYYILFLQNSSNGSIGHWELIMKTINGFIIYSSFGEDIDERILRYCMRNDNFHKSRSSDLKYSTINLQREDSYLCVFYVLYMIDNLLKFNDKKRLPLKENFNNLLYDFKQNSFEVNHKVLLNFFEKS